jgi:hypothetical protein
LYPKNDCNEQNKTILKYSKVDQNDTTERPIEEVGSFIIMIAELKITAMSFLVSFPVFLWWTKTETMLEDK